MNEVREPPRSYFAFITAEVLDDPELSFSAQVLYGRIMGMTHEKGYCWATNSFLAQKMGLSVRTVQGLLNQLSERGYFRIFVIREPKTQEVLERRIYPLIDPAAKIGMEEAQQLQDPSRNESQDPSCKKFQDPSCEKFQDPSCEKLRVFKGEKESNDNNPPIVPQGGRRAAKSVPKHEPELFERFWQAYPQAMRKDRAGAVREWDKLRPDMELMRVMSAALKRQKETELWRRGVGIPYPVRWLRRQRWTDETEEPEAEAPPSRAAPQTRVIENKGVREL